jgi:outer membrane protein assembly factor BamB
MSPATQKSAKPSSRPALLKGATAAALGAVAALGLAGCAGRNIHRELSADPTLLQREWTLATRSLDQALAGDRGSEYSNPILVDQSLVFGNQSVGLVSLYPSLMQVRWTLPIPGGVVSEVAAAGGTLFFGGADGFLYAVNSENGRVSWRYELRNQTISKPAVAGGRVFVTTSDDVVYAFDAGTGKWLWHYRRRTSPLATIHGASAPLIDGSDVLVGLSDGFLVALGVDDGHLKWERRLHQGSKFTDVDAHPVVEGGTLFVPSYDGSLYALKRAGGETIWRFDSGGSKQVAIDDQRVILPSSDGSVYALSKTSGKQLWKFELDGGAPTQLVVTDKHVIVGSTFQYLYVIDKGNGQGLYRFNVGDGSGFAGAPAFDAAKRRLYALSGSGNLYAFSYANTPKPKPRGRTTPWQFD